MKMHKHLLSIASLCLVLTLALFGCGESDSASTDRNTGSTPTDTASASVPDGLFLEEAPEGVTPVGELRASAEEGDEVVMDVFVGGAEEPIVVGRAVMFVVDSKVTNRCTSPDDHCKTPWDYCCNLAEANAAKATVQVVDKDGRPLQLNLGNGVGPLAKLTIKGIVGPRLNNDTLVVNATGIYVEQPAQ